jgi:hypothetical protein
VYHSISLISKSLCLVCFAARVGGWSDGGGLRGPFFARACDMCDRVNEGLISFQSQNEFLSYEPNKNNIMMSQKSGFWRIVYI